MAKRRAPAPKRGAHISGWVVVAALLGAALVVLVTARWVA